MNIHQALAINALKIMIGDDTARMREIFARCTPYEMQGEYSCSGKTRAQYLADCEARDAEIQAAIEWVGAQK